MHHPYRYIHGEKKKKRRNVRAVCEPGLSSGEKRVIPMRCIIVVNRGVSVNRRIFCLLIVISRRPLAINSPMHPGTNVITRFSGGISS